jgi:regulatory protein
VEDGEIGPDLLERWALHYLGRYASSAENLRRVLTRRVRRRAPDAVPAAAALIEALVVRYRESGLLDDAAYAAARVQSLHRRG